MMGAGKMPEVQEIDPPASSLSRDCHPIVIFNVLLFQQLSNRETMEACLKAKRQ